MKIIYVCAHGDENARKSHGTARGLFHRSDSASRFRETASYMTGMNR